VPQLVGNLEVGAVGHLNEMSLMKGEEFPPDVCNLVSLGVGDVCPVMECPELAVCLIDDILVTVGDVDMLVDRKYLGRGEEGTLGLSEALHVVYIGLFSGLSESVIL
jgi:hypothetical protein